MMLRRVCRYMDCDADRFRLTFFDGDAPARDEDGNLLSGAAGVYVPPDGAKRPMIRISTTNLQDPLALVATLAHEVAHDRSLGADRGRQQVSRDRLPSDVLSFKNAGLLRSSIGIQKSLPSLLHVRSIHPACLR